MNDILQSVTHGYNDSEVESISSSSTDSEDSDYVHAMDESESDVSLNIFLLICLTHNIYILPHNFKLTFQQGWVVAGRAIAPPKFLLV